MPRQPFLPAFSHLKYSVGALLPKERPELCAEIGKSIAIWSQVDNEMGNLFGILLGTDSDAALEVFLTLRRASNQVEALCAAAKFKLTGEQLLTFEAMIFVYASLEKQRNSLAHGCFGICPDDTSILFWIEVKDHVHFQTETLSREARGDFATDRHERLKKNMYVYRLQDLQGLYEEMEQFWWVAFYFNGYLREIENSNRITEFNQLREFPAIKSALEQCKAKT